MKKLLIFSFFSLFIFSSCHDDLVEHSPQRGEAMELQAEINQQYATRANDGGFADGREL